MSNTDESEKADESDTSHPARVPVIPRAAISPEELRGLQELSASIQPYLEQNRQIIEEFAKEATLHRSLIEKINFDLSAPLEVRRMLGKRGQVCS
jgi:hypothetical protein